MSNALNKMKDNLPGWSLPTRLVIALMGIIIAIEACAFLYPTPLEFPMDDTYIHFVYADNLISHGKLFFSDMNEKGVGATSPLWVFLLAGLKVLGAPMLVSAKVMGLIGLLGVSAGVYVLFRPIWKSPFLLLAVLLLSLSGNLLWFSLSGMETTLFLAVGMFVLITYRREKWILLGVLIGLLALIRPEGLILLGAIGCVDLWAHRRIRGGILTAGLIGMAISAPWFIYLYVRSGHFLPTSAIGKRFTFMIGLDYVASQNPSLARLIQFRSLAYPLQWFAYLIFFALGGKSLPPPFFAEGGDTLGINSYAPSYWAIPGWLLVVFPLLYAGVRQVSGRERWMQWAKESDSRPLVIFAVWFALHNLAYMFFMPILGTASRYGALNHVVLWLALAMGLTRFMQRPFVVRFMTIGLLAIALANNLYWNRVYDANLEHMRTVRIETAHFIRDSLAADDLCAVFDIGAARYFSQRPILDIGALTNPDERQWFIENKADLYLMKLGATCLILPGQANSGGEGWLDFLKILGLSDSPYFKIEQIAVFEMDYERWLLGYLPTYNQQASVVIYRITRTEQASP